MDKKLHAQAKAVAARCAEAYSFDRYRSWVAVAKELLAAGCSEKEAEAIMRSKWTRYAADWACDRGQRDGKVSAESVLKWMASQRGDMWKQVRQLAQETFPGEDVS